MMKSAAHTKKTCSGFPFPCHHNVRGILHLCCGFFFRYWTSVISFFLFVRLGVNSFLHGTLN